MADLKISALPASTTPLAGTEVLPIVQSSTTKQVSVSDMLGTISGTSQAVDSTGNMFLRVTDALGTGVGAQFTMGGKYNGSSYYAFGGISSRKENATNNNVAGYTDILTTTSGGALTARMRFNSTGDGTMLNGNLVIGTSGKGIDFSATSGSGTSELLSDYEEGTFTATLTPASGSITLKTTNDTLSYTKVGRLVTVTGSLNVLSVSTPSGAVTLGGLPFTIADLTEASGNGAAPYYHYASFVGIYTEGQTSVSLVDDGSTYGANHALYITFSYVAA